MKTFLRVTLLIAALCSMAYGQASPVAFSRAQFFSNAGAPLAAGKLCVFTPGTTTPLTHFTDSLGGGSSTIAYTLDAAGRASVYITNGTPYKLILYAAGGNTACPNSGSTIWTEDNIPNASPAVSITSGTANRVPKYTSASALGNGSIGDLFTGENVRIQTDGTVTFGTTTDIAAGISVVSAESELMRLASTTGTTTFNMYGTSGVMGSLSATVAGGLSIGTSTARLTLNTAGTSFLPVTTDVMALGSSAARYASANIMGMTVNTIAVSGGTSGNVAVKGGTPTIAGNGTLNVGSQNFAGKVTATASAASTIVLTFSSAFTIAPACNVTDEVTANAFRAISTTTTVAFLGTLVSGDPLAYTCFGY